MSADYRTEHFKGYRHDGYIHVERVTRDGEYCVGDFSEEELTEILGMFSTEDGEERTA
jgi:hypothetical protein